MSGIFFFFSAYLLCEECCIWVLDSYCFDANEKYAKALLKTAHEIVKLSLFIQYPTLKNLSLTTNVNSICVHTFWHIGNISRKKVGVYIFFCKALIMETK